MKDAGLRPPGRSTWTFDRLHLGGRELVFKQVSFGDALAAHAEGDPCPWWAHVWPGGERLADVILGGPRLDGLTALDLGAGPGIVGVALGLMGARVTFGDLSEASLALSADNARRAGLTSFELLRLDWNDPPPVRFARVFAADVLYDESFVAPVVRAFSALVEPGGVGFLSDPRRRDPALVLRAAQALGVRADIVRDTPDLVLFQLQPAAH